MFTRLLDPILLVKMIGFFILDYLEGKNSIESPKRTRYLNGQITAIAETLKVRGDDVSTAYGLPTIWQGNKAGIIMVRCVAGKHVVADD
ncbi:hypothetical protein IAR50_007210 [Cryptococcus sp. DSM 104548]